MNPDMRPVGRGCSLVAVVVAWGALVSVACAETGPSDGGTGTTASAPADSRVKVSVVRKGRDVTPEPAAWARLAEAAAAVLRSCSSREKRRIGPPDWDAAVAAETRVYVEFGGPHRIELAGSAALTVTAIVVPAGSPLAVLARNGDTFYSPFTSCDGAALASVLTR